MAFNLKGRSLLIGCAKLGTNYWVPMGQEEKSKDHLALLGPYRVN
jgi:ornithine carbamoyltransferase